MKKIIILITMTASGLAQAQNDDSNPIGEYYLEGVMETASGFRLNENHTFDFFYTYGAIDREGTGVWIQKGDSIRLNGNQKPEKDFKLNLVSKQKGNMVTIRITDPNTMVLGYVSCRVITDGDTLWAESDKGGIITVKTTRVKRIELVHRLWPDRVSGYDLPEEAWNDNYFEFTIEPWITKVEFNNLALKKSGDHLTGEHPLMDGNEFHYQKRN